MVKVLVTSSQETEPVGSPKPVAEDEIDPEAMAEIIRRVEQWRRGETKVYSNEEVLGSLPPDLVRIAELLDELP